LQYPSIEGLEISSNNPNLITCIPGIFEVVVETGQPQLLQKLRWIGVPLSVSFSW
jgi:hypothetical protein